MGRPGEPRRYTKADKDYLKKTAKKRADRNRDHKELEKRTGKLSKKAKGKSKSSDKEAGHTTDYSRGGTKKTPVSRQSVKKNRGWRKGKKGDGGRAATRKRNKGK
jgi:hypothetical protein